MERIWGEKWDSSRANTSESGLSRTTAVGLYPKGASPVGALDMSGNVWEWCLNEYENPDRIDLSSENRRVLRGGSWDLSQSLARCVSRDSRYPDFRVHDIGFRLVSASPILWAADQ